MLSWTGLDYALRPVDADESTLGSELPGEYVRRLALAKGKSAANGFEQRVVIAADTTVADGVSILGKPSNAAEARQMLQRLRGRTHQVYTAVAVYLPNVGWMEDLCESQVPMREYTDAEIERYIQSGDPMDKAGAYAIQNRDFQPVTGFRGCFANVMGLPLCHLTRMLHKGGHKLPADVPHSCQNHLDYDCPVYAAVLAGKDIG